MKIRKVNNTEFSLGVVFGKDDINGIYSDYVASRLARLRDNPEDDDKSEKNEQKQLNFVEQ